MLVFFWQYWDLNSGSWLLGKCSATLPCPQPFWLQFIFQVTSVTFYLGSLGPWSSHFCLLHSWDYRCVSPHTAISLDFLLNGFYNDLIKIKPFEN
jgi:hypothetical protein